LALPRELLDPWLDTLISTSYGAMQDVLTQLKTRPTFQEQWPNEYQAGLLKGKFRLIKLERIRKDRLSIRDIFKRKPEILEWYDSIC